MVNPAPIVVAPDGFVGKEEANRQVQTRLAPWPTINLLIGHGYVQQCFRATDAEEGVTKDSLTAEVEWRRTATWRDHVKRLFRVLDAPF